MRLRGGGLSSSHPSLMWQQDFRSFPPPQRRAKRKRCSFALLLPVLLLICLWVGGAWWFLGQPTTAPSSHSNKNRSRLRRTTPEALGRLNDSRVTRVLLGEGEDDDDTAAPRNKSVLPTDRATLTPTTLINGDDKDHDGDVTALTMMIIDDDKKNPPRNESMKTAPTNDDGNKHSVQHRTRLPAILNATSTTTTNTTNGAAGAGDWQARLLHRAFQSRLEQYPLCWAKVRWYCRERAALDLCDAGDAVTIDAMQQLVADEGAAGPSTPPRAPPACPPVATFSLGRVWRHARDLQIMRRRTEVVPYWRSKLRAVARSTAAEDLPSAAGDESGQEARIEVLALVLSFPRPGQEAFLRRTVLALRRQVQAVVNESRSFNMRIAVMNSGGPERPHPLFEEMKREEDEQEEQEGGGDARRDGGRSGKERILFFDNPFLDFQPSPETELPDHLSANRVAAQIMNQSWHVMSGLAMGHAIVAASNQEEQRRRQRHNTTQKTSYFVMLLEDDMLLCPNGLATALADLHDGALSQPYFRAMLLSYGLNGLIVPAERIFGKEGLLSFLIMNVHPEGCDCVSPPDISVYEWAGFHHYPSYMFDTAGYDGLSSLDGTNHQIPGLGSSYRGIAFTRPTNLFEHLGTSASTFSDRHFEEAQYKCGGALQFSWERTNAGAGSGLLQERGGGLVQVLTRNHFAPPTPQLMSRPISEALDTSRGGVVVVTQPRALRGSKQPNQEITDMIQRKKGSRAG